jgi:hypothetical protein
MFHQRHALICWALCMAAAAAQAQGTVYRCGPDGREYSATPCPGGKAVSVDDARSAEQQRQAREAAQRDAALADKLAAERKQRNAAIRPGAAARIGPTPAASAPGTAASAPHPHKKTKKKPSRKSADPTMSDPVLTPAKAPAK